MEVHKFLIPWQRAHRFVSCTVVVDIFDSLALFQAWVRMAVNDCLMDSYFSSFLREPSTLKQYYKPGAFLRDSELPLIANNYLQGVCTFLPIPNLVKYFFWCPTAFFKIFFITFQIWRSSHYNIITTYFLSVEQKQEDIFVNWVP